MESNATNSVQTECFSLQLDVFFRFQDLAIFETLAYCHMFDGIQSSKILPHTPSNPPPYSLSQIDVTDVKLKFFYVSYSAQIRH